MPKTDSRSPFPEELTYFAEESGARPPSKESQGSRGSGQNAGSSPWHSDGGRSHAPSLRQSDCLTVGRPTIIEHDCRWGKKMLTSNRSLFSMLLGLAGAKLVDVVASWATGSVHHRVDWLSVPPPGKSLYLVSSPPPPEKSQ